MGSCPERTDPRNDDRCGHDHHFVEWEFITPPVRPRLHSANGSRLPVYVPPHHHQLLFSASCPESRSRCYLYFTCMHSYPLHSFFLWVWFGTGVGATGIHLLFLRPPLSRSYVGVLADNVPHSLPALRTYSVHGIQHIVCVRRVGVLSRGLVRFLFLNPGYCLSYYFTPESRASFITNIHR